MIPIDEKTYKADDGMKLTNGTAFGVIVYLGNNDSIDNWHEITEEEKARLEAEWETEPETEATEADYISALEDLGVNFNG